MGRTLRRPGGREHLLNVQGKSDAADWKIGCVSQIFGELSHVGLLRKPSAMWRWIRVVVGTVSCQSRFRGHVPQRHMCVRQDSWHGCVQTRVQLNCLTRCELLTRVCPDSDCDDGRQEGEGDHHVRYLSTQLNCGMSWQFQSRCSGSFHGPRVAELCPRGASHPHPHHHGFWSTYDGKSCPG